MKSVIFIPTLWWSYVRGNHLEAKQKHVYSPNMYRMHAFSHKSLPVQERRCENKKEIFFLLRLKIRGTRICFFEKKTFSRSSHKKVCQFRRWYIILLQRSVYFFVFSPRAEYKRMKKEKRPDTNCQPFYCTFPFFFRSRLFVLTTSVLLFLLSFFHFGSF